MNILIFILQKEFIQIFRNPNILRIIFAMPMMQLLLLPLAANFEMRNINLSIVNKDHSDYSYQFINKIKASGYFLIHDYSDSYKKALLAVEKDQADLIIEIPQGFEKKLIRESEATIFIAANAINGSKAGLGSAYAANIIRNFNQEIRLEWIQLPKINPQPIIEINPLFWFNPLMNYRIFMVPGVLAILLTMVGFFLTSLNIVKEKEIGTIDQLNVTPIKKYQFILGKLIPFWVLGLVVLSLGLLIGRLIYGIVPVGSVLLIYGFSALFLLGILGLGLLVSTFVDTQQQAMFIAYFLLMIFILMGGLFTPIESMPHWAIVLTWFNPVAYFIEILRMIMLKGSQFSDLEHHFWALLGFAFFFNSFAIWNYRKTA